MRLLGIAAGCAVVALAACSGPQVTLHTRPTDLDTARGLARLVADAADCAAFEDYSSHPDHWDFTCQTGPGGARSFTIRTVPSDSARRSAVEALTGFSDAPIKAGDYFLVQQAGAAAQPGAVTALDRFPGELLDTAGR